MWKIKALDEGVRAVSSYLAMPNIVKTLDLMDNGVTSLGKPSNYLGCDFLGKALHPSANKTLQKLMLDHNNIGTEGLKNLCEGSLWITYRPSDESDLDSPKPELLRTGQRQRQASPALFGIH